MTYIISFPRSGQHLVRNILENVCKRTNKQFSYCEFYRCCRQTPCKYKRTDTINFYKNHDFLLDPTYKDKPLQVNINIEDNEKYIVLYRKDPIEQLEAYYRYLKPEISLFEFCKQKKEYYNAFIEKWVTPSLSNVFLLDYDTLIHDPYNSISRLLSFLEIQIDVSDLVEILILQNIKRRYTISPDLKRCLNQIIL